MKCATCGTELTTADAPNSAQCRRCEEARIAQTETALEHCHHFIGHGQQQQHRTGASMTKEQFKDLIIQVVIDKQGCKEMEICCNKQLVEAGMSLDVDILPEETMPDVLIDELVESGKLMAICYRLPTMPYRTKRFLLPAGTILSKNIL